MPIFIFEDAAEGPELFHRFGVAELDFDQWLSALPMLIHPGLVSFWRRTGGGHFFASETILGPLHPDGKESVLEVNQFHWAEDLPRDMVLFHTGKFCSASRVDRRRHRNRLVTLKPDSYEVDREFATLRDWYSNAIRPSFRETYQLRSG
jgi:hypothetical protein